VAFISFCSLLGILFHWHDAGHGKIETMGALSISALLMVTGGGIAWNAIDTLQAWTGYPFIRYIKFS